MIEPVRAIFATVAVIGALFSATEGCAQTVTIGLPAMPQNVDAAHGTDLASRLAQDLISAPLLAFDGSTFSTRNALVDRVSVKDRGRTVTARLSRRARCGDGTIATPADVEFSFGQCGLDGEIALEGEQRRNEQGNIEHWVTLRAKREAPLSKLAERLYYCPILKERIARVFGADLGKGSNVVGCGPFGFHLVKAGTEVQFQRVAAGRALVELVTLRAVADSQQGLGLLRTGQIDALFDLSEEETERVEADETLAVTHCYGIPVAYRNGLTVSCTPRMNSAALGYRPLE